MITAERLREVLHYNPETGQWHWLVTLSNRAMAFAEAGSHRRRRDITIRVDGTEYKAHRLAWLYMTGEWPPDQIDHKNLCRADNRWDNLRLANNSQNNANRPVRSDSVTRVKNVSYYPKKSVANPYVAYGRRKGKKIYLGCFATLETAASVALHHAQGEFGGFAHP
jgi:hypothetical protein